MAATAISKPDTNYVRFSIGHYNPLQPFFQILIMRLAGSSQAPALISSADLTPFAEPLLHGLFGAFELQASAENEYVMKCIMRSFSTLQVSLCVWLVSYVLIVINY
jgi:hypothetical protein